MRTTPEIQTDPRLDWSIHAHPLNWPISAKTFLADAVLRVGKALCDPWYNDEPAALAVPISPDLANLDNAFAGEQPIPAIHAQHRAQVLSVISFPVYWDMIDREDDGAEPADDEPITRDHWEQVLIEISVRENLRIHARRAIIHVARFIARQAVAGTLRTYARPMPGGLPEELPSHFWELFDPRPRIASCSFNLEDPTNPSASPTHFIFVDAEDLQNAINGIKPTDRVNLIPELDGATERSDPYVVSTLEVTSWLKKRHGRSRMPLDSSHVPPKCRRKIWKPCRRRGLQEGLAASYGQLPAVLQTRGPRRRLTIDREFARQSRGIRHPRQPNSLVSMQSATLPCPSPANSGRQPEGPASDSPILRRRLELRNSPAPDGRYRHRRPICRPRQEHLGKDETLRRRAPVLEIRTGRPLFSRRARCLDREEQRRLHQRTLESRLSLQRPTKLRNAKVE